MKLFKNRYFILGNLLLILLAIPLTLFFIKNQQDQRSRAAPSSALSIVPRTKTVAIGEQFDLDVSVNPGENIVSIVDIHLIYDQEKLEFVKFTPNSAAFPTVLRDPVADQGNFSVSLNIGGDVTRAIQSTTKAGAITFKAVKTTADTPTLVSFDSQKVRVYSLRGNEEGTCDTPDLDCPGENVFDNATPGSVIITDSETSLTPTPSAITPTPTIPVGGTNPTPTPTGGGSGGGGGGSGGTANVNPICTGLSIDRETTGSAPYSLTFTANGTDSDGTLQKVTLNFGDGPTQDVSSAGGIGTSQVSIQVAHTYNNPGTYEASAILTDNGGAISDSATCKQTITVNAAPTQASGGGSGGSSSGGTAPTGTIAPSGNFPQTLGIVGAVIFTVLGGIFLFTL